MKNKTQNTDAYTELNFFDKYIAWYIVPLSVHIGKTVKKNLVCKKIYP